MRDGLAEARIRQQIQESLVLRLYYIRHTIAMIRLLLRAFRRSGSCSVPARSVMRLSFALGADHTSGATRPKASGVCQRSGRIVSQRCRQSGQKHDRVRALTCVTKARGKWHRGHST